jgi:Putative beta barrel porin-7 (BBP7)
VPPLVTQGDPADTPTGAIGQPGTRILFGDRSAGANPFNGGRLNLGLWLNREQTWGIDGNYFFLATRHTSFTAANDSTGTTTLNVPFFNADLNAEDARQIAVPGVQSGTTSVSTSQRLMGYELNLRGRLVDTDTFRLALLGGFRYVSLQESLDLNTHFDFVPLAFGISSDTFDSFGTRNRFYGGQIGLAGEMNRDRWVFGAQAKVALGSVNQRINITGSNTVTDPFNGAVTTPGGIFSAASNMGEFNRSVFCVVPEVGLTMGYQVTRNLTATVGYNFLYMSNVVRPGDQIDRGINFAAPANGPTRPSAGFNSTDFWAQGINFGLQFRY